MGEVWSWSGNDLFSSILRHTVQYSTVCKTETTANMYMFLWVTQILDIPDSHIKLDSDFCIYWLFRMY